MRIWFSRLRSPVVADYSSKIEIVFNSRRRIPIPKQLKRIARFADSRVPQMGAFVRSHRARGLRQIHVIHTDAKFTSKQRPTDENSSGRVSGFATNTSNTTHNRRRSNAFTARPVRTSGRISFRSTNTRSCSAKADTHTHIRLQIKSWALSLRKYTISRCNYVYTGQRRPSANIMILCAPPPSRFRNVSTPNRVDIVTGFRNNNALGKNRIVPEYEINDVFFLFFFTPQ